MKTQFDFSYYGKKTKTVINLENSVFRVRTKALIEFCSYYLNHIDIKYYLDKDTVSDFEKRIEYNQKWLKSAKDRNDSFSVKGWQNVIDSLEQQKINAPKVSPINIVFNEKDGKLRLFINNDFHIEMNKDTYHNAQTHTPTHDSMHGQFFLQLHCLNKTGMQCISEKIADMVSNAIE